MSETKYSISKRAGYEKYIDQLDQPVSKHDVFQITYNWLTKQYKSANPEKSKKVFDQYSLKELMEFFKDIAGEEDLPISMTTPEHSIAVRLAFIEFAKDHGLHDTRAIKEASTRNLSIRQAEGKNVVELIEADPDLKAAVQSYCRFSGGTKSVSSIINFLREKLGNELVRFSDPALIKYIERIKKENGHSLFEAKKFEIGQVGTESQNTYDDATADYITHGK